MEKNPKLHTSLIWFNLIRNLYKGQIAHFSCMCRCVHAKIMGMGTMSTAETIKQASICKTKQDSVTLENVQPDTKCSE